MTLTLDLPAEMEHQLAEAAARSGQAPAELARAAVAEKLAALEAARVAPPEKVLALLDQWDAEDAANPEGPPSENCVDELELLKRKWRLVREELKRDRKTATVHACLAGTEPSRLERGELSISFPSKTMAELFACRGKAWSELVAQAIQRVSGIACRVHSEFGGEAVVPRPVPPAPRPVVQPAAAPQEGAQDHPAGEQLKPTPAQSRVLRVLAGGGFIEAEWFGGHLWQDPWRQIGRVQATTFDVLRQAGWVGEKALVRHRDDGTDDFFTGWVITEAGRSALAASEATSRQRGAERSRVMS